MGGRGSETMVGGEGIEEETGVTEEQVGRRASGD